MKLKSPFPLWMLLSFSSVVSATNYSLTKTAGASSSTIDTTTSLLQIASFGTGYSLSSITGTTLSNLAASNTFSLDGANAIPLTIRHADTLGLFPTVSIAADIALNASGSSLTLQPSASKTLNITGTTTVSSGTTLIVNGAASSANIALNSIAVNSGTVQISAGTTTFNQDWTGTGGVLDVRSTSGTVTIKNALSATTLKAGRSINFAPPSSTTIIISADIVDNPAGGAGSVVVNGSSTGSVNFTGANTYAGSTVVSAGTLRIVNAQNLSGALSIAGSATLDLANTADVTHTGTFSGAGYISKSGSYKATLNGDPTGFTGAFKIYEGTLKIGNTWSTGKPDLNIQYCATGAALEIESTTGTVGSPSLYSGDISNLNGTVGATKFSKKGSGALELSGSTLQLNTIYVDEGALIIRAQSLPSSTTTVNSSALYAIKTENNVTSTLSQPISGTGNVRISETGALSINTAQTYTGTTTIDGGILYYGTDGALSPSTDVIVNSTNSGTLSLHSANGAQSYSGTISSLAGAGTLALGTGTLTCGNSGDQTFSGSITGVGGIVKSGVGTWTVSGNNAGNIATVAISNGTIKLGNDESLGSAAIALTGGNLDTNGYNPANTISALHGEIKNSGCTASVLTSSLPLTGTSVLNAANNSLTIQSSVTGAYPLSLTGGLLKNLLINGDIAVDSDIVASTATITHSGRLTAYTGRSYTIQSGLVEFSPSAILSLRGSSFKINSNALNLIGSTIQLDEGYIGSMSTLSTDGGGSIVLATGSTVDVVVPYAKTLEISLGITGAGDLEKSSLGALRYSGNTFHTGATTIIGGSLVLTDNPVSCGSQAITLDRYGILEIETSAQTRTDRAVTGAGHLIKSGSSTLTMTGEMTYSGNTMVKNGSLIFSGSNTIGPVSKIWVAAGKSLEYQGDIYTLGSSLNINLDSNATLTFNGATIYTTSITGRDLTIGTASSVYNIGPSGLKINADNPVTLRCLLGSGTGTLTKEGSSSLALKSIGNAYSGSIALNTGSLILNDNYANNSNITVASGAALIWDIDSTITSTKNITGLIGSSLIKQGSGTLRVIAAGKIDSFEGTIRIEKGNLQFRNTSLHANSTVFVCSGANLDILSSGDSNATISMPTVSLQNRASLRIMKENPAAENCIRQIEIASLTGQNGSVIVLQFDPAQGSQNAPLSSTAPLKITRLTTANANRDKIFLQVRPISTQPLVPGNIYALIEPNGDTTSTEMVNRLRIMPSIVYSSKYTIDRTPGVSPNICYGNLLYNTDGIFMKIGAAEQGGFYSGAMNTTNLEAACPPTNSYYQAFIGQILGRQDIPIYSPLDQLLTSQNLAGNISFAALTPQSAQDIHLMFLKPIDRPQSMFPISALPGKRSIIAHHNLQPHTQVKTHGAWIGWTKDFFQSHISTNGRYLQEQQGQITGISLELSSEQTVGYQYAQVMESYRVIGDDSLTTIDSKISQLHTSHQFSNSYWENNLCIATKQVNYDRSIAVEIDTYIESWNALSAHQAYELEMQGGIYQDALSSAHWNGGLGLEYQGRCAWHEGYQERGAGDLNLRVEAYQIYQYHLQPVLNMRYQWQSQRSSGLIQAKAGLEYQELVQDPIQSALVDYPDVSMPGIALNQKYISYIFSLESISSIGKGVSISWRTQAFYNIYSQSKEYKSTCTLLYAF